MDFGTTKKVFIGQFVRVKVLFDTTYPLVPGFFYRCPSSEDVWVQFKYERLIEFCFTCGRLGHASLNYIMPVSEREPPNIFGPKMKAKSLAYRWFSAPKSFSGAASGLSSIHVGRSAPEVVASDSRGNGVLSQPFRASGSQIMVPRQDRPNKATPIPRVPSVQLRSSSSVTAWVTGCRLLRLWHVLLTRAVIAIFSLSFARVCQASDTAWSCPRASTLATFGWAF